jgi:hypothetical protein
MYIVYSNTEFKPGTLLRRIYQYDDDGDVIMTDEILYEELAEDEDEARDGPEEEEDL